MGERLRWPSGKESACQCRRCRFYPWLGKIPWRGKWQPTPVFLSGKSHGQRSLVGYSPWGHKESDMTRHAWGFFCLFVFYILDRQIVYFQVISHSELFRANDSGRWSLWTFNLLPSSPGLSPEPRNAMLAASLSVWALGLLCRDWPLLLPSVGFEMLPSFRAVMQWSKLLGAVPSVIRGFNSCRWIHRAKV